MPDSEIYLSRPKSGVNKDDNQNSNIQTITTAPGIVVFEFHSPLIFLNAESFKRRFTKTILAPIKEAQLFNLDHSNLNIPKPIHSVIFDCGRVGYLDSKGVEMLAEMATELKESGGIQLLLASCSELIFKTLLKENIFTIEGGEKSALSVSKCFVSVHDAVTAALNGNKIEKSSLDQKHFQVLTVNT